MDHGVEDERILPKHTRPHNTHTGLGAQQETRAKGSKLHAHAGHVHSQDLLN